MTPTISLHAADAVGAAGAHEAEKATVAFNANHFSIDEPRHVLETLGVDRWLSNSGEGLPGSGSLNGLTRAMWVGHPRLGLRRFLRLLDDMTVRSAGVDIVLYKDGGFILDVPTLREGRSQLLRNKSLKTTVTDDMLANVRGVQPWWLTTRLHRALSDGTLITPLIAEPSAQAKALAEHNSTLQQPPTQWMDRSAKKGCSFWRGADKALNAARMDRLNEDVQEHIKDLGSMWRSRFGG